MFEYELKKLNLSEKREQQLKLPYIAKDVETIRIMTEIYCHAHHNTKEGLCPECEEFYLYSVKRLACCPFGEKKPVCAKCKIHCYGKGYKERAKEIMAFSGPKLLLKHPILSMRHVMALNLRKNLPQPNRVHWQKKTIKLPEFFYGSPLIINS